MEVEKKIYNIHKINMTRCVTGITMGVIMVILSIVALILNVANFFQDVSPESGMGTLRMFTTLSNLLVAIAAFLIISYQVDGLRRGEYHLPHWIIDLLYIGVTGVSITFVVAISVISAAQGFDVAMFHKSNLFLHTINPIIAMILFTYINCDHHIKFYKSFITLIPISIYAVVYYVMAIAIGEANGGWRDVYALNAYIPWPITYILLALTAFGLSNLLRFLHNKRFQSVEDAIKNYYLYSDYFDGLSIEEAIGKIAKDKIQPHYQIKVPVSTIKLLKERYNSDKSIIELSKIYVDNCVIDNK